MVVVTSEGLVRVDDREGRSASGDCEGDSNKYEDFSHGRILSKKYLELAIAAGAAAFTIVNPYQAFACDDDHQGS